MSGLELDISSPKQEKTPEQRKEDLLLKLHNVLPEDTHFWQKANIVDHKITSLVGAENLIDIIESKQDFIDFVESQHVLDGSVKQLLWYVYKMQDSFYSSPREVSDLKTQVRLHAQLGDTHRMLGKMHKEGNIRNGIWYLLLRADLETLALESLSKEEVVEFNELLSLYNRLVSVDRDFFRNKEFLSSAVQDKIHASIENFKNSPDTIGTEELDRVEYALKWWKKAFMLQDAFNRNSTFMPEYIRDRYQHEISGYTENPWSLWSEEFEKMKSDIGISRKYFEKMKDVIIAQSDIDSLFPDATFDMSKEPYNTLFSSLTVFYMESYALKVKSADDFLKENDQGLAIQPHELKTVLKQVADYLVDTKFENKITLRLSGWEDFEITGIISWEQERVEFTKKEETKKILTFFSLLNNNDFPTTQNNRPTDMEAIAKILEIKNPNLIAQIEKFGVMAWVEQSRNLEAVAWEIVKQRDLWIISQEEIYTLLVHFIKPGSQEWNILLSRLVSIGLINDSDSLKILEWPHGFQEDGGISLNEYLEVHGLPTRMKQAITMIIGRRLSNQEMNNILIDEMYVNAIETRGWYNIQNDKGWNAKWYKQIIATQWKFDSKGFWKTSSMWTGLRAFPQDVLDMYPELDSLYQELPKRTTDINQQAAIIKRMKKRDPRKLSAEAQMIWRIVDSYVRRDVAKPHVDKILRGDFSWTEYIYATIHHTEWLTHGPTKRAMKKWGNPILQNKQQILSNIWNRKSSIQVASVWSFITTNTVEEDPVERTTSKPVPQKLPEPRQENTAEILLKENSTTTLNIPKGWTLGKSLYAGISKLNPSTSFKWSWEVAVLLQWDVWNITVQAGESIEVSSVNRPKDYAYYVKIWASTHIAITKNKKFIML